MPISLKKPDIIEVNVGDIVKINNFDSFDGLMEEALKKREYYTIKSIFSSNYDGMVYFNNIYLLPEQHEKVISDYYLNVALEIDMEDFSEELLKDLYYNNVEMFYGNDSIEEEPFLLDRINKTTDAVCLRLGDVSQIGKNAGILIEFMR